MRRRCAERVEQGKVEQETWSDSLNRWQKLYWNSHRVSIVRQHGSETALLGVAVAEDDFDLLGFALP